MDPACLFMHGTYEEGVAAILNRGKNVANLGNYDERIVQKVYVNKLKASSQIVAIGSSRTMEIRSSFFTGKTFFNNSVSGATLEDIIAICQLYLNKNLKPEKIIIGLDPWVLNMNNQQTRWRSLENEYHSAPFISSNSNSCFGSQNNLAKYKELISAAYLSASINKLIMKIHNKEIKYFETEDKSGKTAIKLADGSLVNDEKTRKLHTDEIRKHATDYAATNPIYSLGGFNELSRDHINKFESLINHLQNQGIEVMLFLPPYHPLVYKKISNDSKYKMLLEAESYFVKSARNKNIKLIGSYNPFNLNCRDDDFFDGMHPKESLLLTIFNTER